MSIPWNRCGLLRPVTFLLATVIPGLLVLACPFCDAPSITYSEQLKDAQAVLFVQWDSAEKPNALDFEPGSTTYRVVTPFRQTETALKAGDSVKIPFYQNGKPGDTFWMLGASAEEKFNWSPPVPMSKECWDYVMKAPDRDKPMPERLRYYVQFLEHPDQEIGIDAYGEFAGAPYDDVVAIRDVLPRAKLRIWLTDPEITPSRRGLYGLMLGLCGTREDAKFIEPILLERQEFPRLGIDGMMAGYILLTGDSGFKTLTEAKLVQRDVITSETFAMLQTMRFLWQYAPKAVSRDQLIHAMRQLLDHPEFASFAIIDLARWRNWESVPLLTQRYGKGAYADRHIKESVIRFLILAAKEESEEAAPSVAAARTMLDQLRMTDSALVNAVERRAFD